jgi:high-affinity K+ transport system ATPase subunit B
MGRIATPPDNEAIRELRDAVKDLSKSTKQSNTVMVRLTYVLLVVGLIQVVVTVRAISKGNIEWLLFSGVILLFLIFWIWFDTRKNKNL